MSAQQPAESEAAQELIEWRETRWAEEGYAGGFNLFTVGYGTTRSDSMYYLHTSLPVKGEHIGQVHPTPTHAKVAAERVLREFIARISTPVADR